MKPIFVAYLPGPVAFFGSSLAYACPECWWNSSVPSDKRRSERDWMDGMPSIRRHHYVMNRGIPEAYRRLDNPLAATQKMLVDGQPVQEQSRVACHGEQGRGEGPAGEAL